MGLSLVFAMLVHVALFLVFEGFFKPKAYVVDQTSYRVSLNARANDSQVMPNPQPVVKQPAQVKPKPETDTPVKKTSPEPVKEDSKVVDKPELKPERLSEVPQQVAKHNEKAAPSTVEQITSTEFKKRRVSQAEPEVKKPEPQAQLSTHKQTSLAPETQPKQIASAEPIKRDAVAQEQKPAIQPVEESVEKVREPQFQIGSPNNPKPTYPQRAINRGWEGDVVLGVHVDADGTVTYVEILESSDVSALDFAAYSTVMDNWRFSPADEDERELRGFVTVPISFRIN